MSEPYLGQIIIFAGNFAIRGFAMCHGQTLPINQNSALFSILGTTYGGDGRTNFKLPDLRGRIAMQQGQGPGLPDYQLGATGGATIHQLTTAQLPAHHHGVAIPVNSDDASNDDPDKHYLGTSEENIYSQTPEAGKFMGTFNSGNTGNGQPFSVQNPYLAVNYLIALTGVFPSRS